MCDNTSKDDMIYHMCPYSSWVECKNTPGKEYYPPNYEMDGFIHATKDLDEELLLNIANHFYKDASPGNEEWVVLGIDTKKLTSKVVFEKAAPVGETAEYTGDGGGNDDDDEKQEMLFPHIYGTIDSEAVISMYAMKRDGESGVFLGIDGESKIQ